jgi:hypothetical protein
VPGLTEQLNQLERAALSFCAVGGDAVLTTELGDGIALLDLRANEYFTLNGVGALLWRQLQAPQSKFDLIEVVQAHYEIDAERCAGDVDVMLDDLIAAGLVHVR